MGARSKRVVAFAAAVVVGSVAVGCDTRLEIGDGSSWASSVSDRGWIVGSYQPPGSPNGQGFVVEPDGDVQFVELPPGRCGGRATLTEVNVHGTAIGEHFTNTCGGAFSVPVRWTRTEGIERLPGTVAGTPYGINDAGQITGLAVLAGPQPVVWEADGTIRELTPVADGAFTPPAAINERGDVIGVAPDGPVLWRAAGGPPVALPTTGLAGPIVATDLNDAGDVVGEAVVDGRGRAVWWPGGGQPMELADGVGASSAAAIDAVGGIVGWVTIDDESRRRAAYWTPGTHELHVLADLGAVSAEAHDISDDGPIVGFVRLADGRTEAARWDRPDPQS